ncbi:YrhC family protein [Ectobacillus antri]|jgi:large-conductance mechanosensitive channel|uniref:YrhC family protein n=1 Tax=Ectobacillus antri TaxID=2486280 RepID=A0ABT6H1B5_9BACI|nr:YrhC family protein [Ectobacillus antri]MDG4655438.1 YrhC family protein [Ectobacillus antri]MDG5753196.1 YrhC family protein [Ectobacillus antri]
MKQLRQKIDDYTRFAQVLLALSTILMTGLLIPNGDKEALQLYVMMGAIILFLLVAFGLFYQVKKLREQLDEVEETLR